MPTLKYDIGYYGYAKIGGIPVLVTDGSVTYEHNPIYAQGVWGAGFTKNKNVLFAPDYPTLTVSLGFQLTDNNVFTHLNDFAGKNRNSGKDIIVSPNGTSGYSGTTYCQSISFSTSRDSLVTCSIQGKTAEFSSEITSTSKSVLNAYADQYKKVFPYYGTSMTLGNRSDIDGTSSTITQLSGLVQWTVNQSSDVVFAKSCNADISGLSGLVADFIAFGLPTIDGDFTNLWAGNGYEYFGDSTNFRKFFSSGSVTLIPVQGASHTVAFGSFELTQNSAGTRTGTEMVETQCSFTGVGTTCLSIT